MKHFWQLVFKIKITRGIFLEVQQFIHGSAFIVRKLLSKYQEMLKVSNRDYLITQLIRIIISLFIEMAQPIDKIFRNCISISL